MSRAEGGLLRRGQRSAGEAAGGCSGEGGGRPKHSPEGRSEHGQLYGCVYR